MMQLQNNKTLLYLKKPYSQEVVPYAALLEF